MASTAAALLPPRRLAAAGLGNFLLLGLLYPILGPALPTLSEHFHLSGKGASLLLSLNSAGAFAGVLLAGGLSRSWPPPRRAALALGLLAAGCLGLILAPTFGLALASSGLLGLGFGVLDLTTNVWLSTAYGERSASMLNLLSASFGVGAVLAPLAVGLAGGDFHRPLLGCAALAAGLLPLMFTLRGAAGGVVTPAARATGRSRALLLGFVGLFLTYVAVEGGVGAWEVTHLQGVLDLTTASAASLTALFWVSFTVGRLVSAALALRLEPARLVTVSLVLAAASLALACVPVAAPTAYTLTGLFLAPVFTTGLVWLARTLPGSGVTTLVFASAFLGPVLFSPVVGAFKDVYGAPAIPVTLLGVTLLCLATALGLRRALRS
ncbi:MFS transporter [Deinococcus apachensis]|uniref:MFS transporter n=1 Tax=Deinococcus apachensis TaxID=309886 RepID=UPI00036AB594|nr:MFS transporter [Deinococcus apachensis]